MRTETPFASTRDALDYLLEGYSLTPEEIDDFKVRFEEDQYLDYKDGRITARANIERGRRTVREYVSGFANSEGGILIVGITDKEPREVSGCSRTGKESLDKWAESLLTDIAPKLSPPPRMQVVEHPKGEVLVIAVPRALELVPCVESRRLSYYMRFHQSTIAVPPFLITDLVLGRRRYPSVDLDAKIGHLPPILTEPTCTVPFYISAENVGLVTAEHLQLGMISWSTGEPGKPLNPHLMSYIDLGDEPHIGETNWRLQHGITRPRNHGAASLSPFAGLDFEAVEGFVFPFSEEPVDIGAALYLLSHGAPPLWFELQFMCRKSGTAPLISDCKIKKILGRRAKVFACKGDI